MDKPKMLSGHELVARGTTKIDGSLPEIGLKDVIPNGSWLEQKQIQSALEARKQLIKVERIEKCGVLSHAEWREELMLAEVTQMSGGHWQYLGHNVGKQLFLKPEEALFLIEVNCLQLKHNDVTVSLQQAYSLLLRGKISLFQYKVYASLSRLGYKVFRHDKKLSEKKVESSGSDHIVDKNNDKCAENCDMKEIKEVTSARDIDEDSANKQTDIDDAISECNITNQARASNGECSIDNINTSSNECNGRPPEVVSSSGCSVNNTEKGTVLVTIEMDTENVVAKEFTDIKANNNDECNSDNLKDTETEKLDQTNTMDAETVKTTGSKEECIMTNVCETQKEPNNSVLSSRIAQSNNSYPGNHHSKLQILESRKVKPCNSKDLQKNFEIVPEMFQKHVVSVKVPEEKYVPNNVVLNSSTYMLNIENIKSKVNEIPTPSSSRTYSIPEEVSGAHVRRVRDANQGTPNRPVNNWSHPFNPNTNFPGQNHFRPFNFWRPRTNMNFFQFNLLFHRPFMPNMNFIPRLPLLPRPPPLIHFANPNFNGNSENRNMPNSRKRMRDGAKQYHFQAIKRLAIRLKQLLQMGNMQTQNIVALQRLIQTYNTRYKVDLSLTDGLDIIEREVIVETIDLEDEEESVNKKARTEHEPNKYEENFNKLKQLALKLKDLDATNKTSARHRRAFSNLVKRFNKSYNSDVSMTNYEVYDRRHISLDSSSDSDCIVEEPVTPSGKKLRNPFNILKRLSEKHNSSISKPTSSKETTVQEAINTEDKKYSQFLINTFKNWLPNEDDFGRAEILPKNNMYNYLIESKREEFLYEFMKNQQYNFDNWLDAKASFLRNIAETTAFVVSEVTAEDRSELNSIIGPGDCTDMPSILSKLSIIPSYKQVDNETSLCIDFDVYNRDVQNFRKTSPPKPHFRVICLNESSNVPTGNDVAALHAQYEDNVVIIFAIVSLGSISYLQMNPTNLPVYIPSNDFT